MIGRIFTLTLVFVFVVSVPSGVFGTHQSRTALVIGNSNYTNAPLINPVNDATDMGATLRDLGFDVTLRTDADQRSMEDSIRAFGRTLHSGGVGLFYYAGHGLQYRRRNYLIPINSEIKSESDVKYEAVDAGRVLAQMEEARNSLNIIILDACRNNPFARSFRSAEQGLVRMDAPTGSILAYSTAPGSIAADGTGRNGLYTESLLKHMKTPGIDLPHLFMKVRRDVVSATNRRQVPWESSSLLGTFYFVKKRGVTVTENRITESPTISIDTAKLSAPFSKNKNIRTLRVGLFPMKNYIDFYGQYSTEWHVELLFNTILNDPRFFMSHSYYDIERIFELSKDKKKPDPIPKNIEKVVWQRKSIFSNEEPNIVEIFKVAEKLGIDIAILLGQSNSSITDFTFNLTFLDRKPKKVFQVEKKSYYSVYKDELTLSLKKEMDNVIKFRNITNGR